MKDYHQISWHEILRANLRLLGGAMLLFVAWLAWSAASPYWWGLWIIVFCSGLGGAFVLIGAIYKINQLMSNARKLRRFGTQAPKQKADAMVSDQTLQEKGLTK